MTASRVSSNGANESSVTGLLLSKGASVPFISTSSKRKPHRRPIHLRRPLRPALKLPLYRHQLWRIFRDATIRQAGLNRTFDLIRQLDELVYEACKGL